MTDADNLSGRRSELHTVEDENGVEKQMFGWPVGFREFDIPTGDSNIDWRCPCCESIASWSRFRSSTGNCVNMDCRVREFNPFVDEVEP